jgi:hypothetical protein
VTKSVSIHAFFTPNSLLKDKQRFAEKSEDDVDEDYYSNLIFVPLIDNRYLCYLQKIPSVLLQSHILRKAQQAQGGSQENGADLRRT